MHQLWGHAHYKAFKILGHAGFIRVLVGPGGPSKNFPIEKTNVPWS